MKPSEPLYRIKVVEKDVERYQHDVEEWKQQLDELESKCWVWEELIAKANYLFERFVKLDDDIQRSVLTGELEYDPAVQEEMSALLREWLDVSCCLVPHTDRIAADYGSADGTDELRTNIKAAEAMLTPDDEFFTGEKLVSLRDAAFDEHQRGETRALLEDEFRP